MNGELFKICAVAVLCAVTGAVLGRIIGGVGIAVRLAGLALVLGGTLALLAEAVSGISALGAEGAVTEYTRVMLKGLGLAVLSRICSDVCRDCGEPSLAGAVETACKLSLCLLALPLVVEVISVAAELLEGL